MAVSSVERKNEGPQAAPAFVAVCELITQWESLFRRTCDNFGQQAGYEASRAIDTPIGKLQIMIPNRLGFSMNAQGIRAEFDGDRVSMRVSAAGREDQFFSLSSDDSADPRMVRMHDLIHSAVAKEFRENQARSDLLREIMPLLGKDETWTNPDRSSAPHALREIHDLECKYKAVSATPGVARIRIVDLRRDPASPEFDIRVIPLRDTHGGIISLELHRPKSIDDLGDAASRDVWINPLLLALADTMLTEVSPANGQQLRSIRDRASSIFT